MLSRARRLGGLAVAIALAGGARAGEPAPTADWPVTEGAPGGGRHSPLADIDRANVARLERVWTHRHGDFRESFVPFDEKSTATAFEATPIVIEGRLIFPTPYNRVIALDPETGALLWSFDPEVDTWRLHPNMLISRGVTWWRDPGASGACASRIFLGTLDARLIALDAATGRPCPGFGTDGQIDLTDGIEPLVDPYEYAVTSPPVVAGGLVIVGSAIADVVRRHQPAGAVRAFDARTGRLAWRFDTIPRAGEVGAGTWKNESWKSHGGANVWSTMTVDVERGLVFLPVSTAGPDFFGGDRPGANLFTDSVVALDAATGRRVWHYQTVHHDLWDYDLPAPPNLVKVRHGSREVDAVAQVTKMGMVFVLDRETGKPLFPVEERPVPASDVPGESAWPTQPFPTRPPPLVNHRFGETDLWDADPDRLAACRERLRGLRNEGIYTPPSERGSVVFPFTGGGANWGGAAFDPASHRLFVPVIDNYVHVVRLIRLPDANVADEDGVVIDFGLESLWWLLTGRGTGLRWFMERSFFGEDGMPCLKPPWGWLAAVDLDRGEIAWRVPTGEKHGIRGLAPMGPALATAGGLVFHGGAADLQLRAHDAETGEVLARFDVPAGLNGGIITYKLHPGGRQFVVVAAGGHGRLGTPLGDWILAFALPE